MRLADLSRPQWDAAIEVARLFRELDPRDAEDCETFRAAKARLVELLPDGADAREIITQAVRWSSTNDIAAALALIPNIAVSSRMMALRPEGVRR